MSDSNKAPGLPEITDEAGDSPLWLPAVGVALLVLMALMWIQPGEDGAAPAAASTEETAEPAAADDAE
jgi:hypothetical protein